MSGYGWRCHLEQDFLNGTHRLFLAQRRVEGHIDILGADGLMHTLPDDGRSLDLPLPSFPLDGSLTLAESRAGTRRSDQ